MLGAENYLVGVIHQSVMCPYGSTAADRRWLPNFVLKFFAHDFVGSDVKDKSEFGLGMKVGSRIVAITLAHSIR